MSQETRADMSLFRRLAKDTTANTLAIAAASLVPLMAMVGGAVDSSRYFMAASRLQAACDAGALAARRAMDNNNFDETHKKTGTDFFDNNYEKGLFGLEDLSRDYNVTTSGEVNGTASGTMPTTIMAAFGFEDLELSVSCQADINIADTDIMLVLDVTGSMAWRPDGTNCGQDASLRWIECSGSRIGALRTAVGNFYDTIETATSSAAQVRYGIVPYSMQANTGRLLNAAWLKNTHEYESRETVFSDFTPSSDGSDGYNVTRTSGSYNGSFVFREVINYSRSQPSLEACQAAFDNLPGHLEVSSFDLDDDFVEVNEIDGTPDITVYDGIARFNFVQKRSGSYSGGVCTLSWNRWDFRANAIIVEAEGGWVDWNYRYGEVDWPISDVYASGSQVELPTGLGASMQMHNWEGCVEMPATANTGTFNPIPSAAFDLDIDLVPTTEDQKWAPVLQTANFARFNGSGAITESDVTTKSDYDSPYTSCPKEARKLAEFNSKSELTDYLKASEGFVADGSTYLDVGMIWGAKLISPSGIFASENATTSSGSSISRHIVFMTDGEASPNVTSASAYGAEFWSRKITSDGLYDTALARHEARLQAACRAARNLNITVWVVAFGETFTDASGNPVVPDNLKDCATPGRAYAAADAAQLDTAFREIAEKIADLRLTQ